MRTPMQLLFYNHHYTPYVCEPTAFLTSESPSYFVDRPTSVVRHQRHQGGPREVERAGVLVGSEQGCGCVHQSALHQHGVHGSQTRRGARRSVQDTD